MQRTDTPKTGKTTYHRDGTVTLWDCIRQQWVRGANVSDEVLATLSDKERTRVIKHTA